MMRHSGGSLVSWVFSVRCWEKFYFGICGQLCLRTFTGISMMCWNKYSEQCVPFKILTCRYIVFYLLFYHSIHISQFNKVALKFIS